MCAGRRIQRRPLPTPLSPSTPTAAAQTEQHTDTKEKTKKKQTNRARAAAAAAGPWAPAHIPPAFPPPGLLSALLVPTEQVAPVGGGTIKRRRGRGIQAAAATSGDADGRGYRRRRPRAGRRVGFKRGRPQVAPRVERRQRARGAQRAAAAAAKAAAAKAAARTGGRGDVALPAVPPTALPAPRRWLPTSRRGPVDHGRGARSPRTLRTLAAEVEDKREKEGRGKLAIQTTSRAPVSAPPVQPTVPLHVQR